MRLAFRFAAFLTIIALSALASCGGAGLSGGASAPVIDAAWPGHGWDEGARDGSFVAVAVDSTERNVVDLTRRLRIETTREGANTLVTVYGSEVDSHSAYLHLKYDGARVHPVEAQRGTTLPEDTLFLGITTLPGAVNLGVTTVGGGNLPGGELELAQVRFSPGAFTEVRTVSTASSQAPNDLRFVGNDLAWSYNAPGDFDQNSETNIADLTPLGVHLNHSTTDGVHDPADIVVDGDGNGLVTIAELTVIGANILRRTTAYRVETAPTDAGPFTPVAGGNVPQNTGVLPAGGGRLEYTFDFAPQAMAFYQVHVLDGTEEGPASNQVQFGVVGGGPPQNLSAADDGVKITLTWSPPASGSPTGYDAYVADNLAMTGAVKMNGATPVTGTTFDCNPIAVPVGVPHFFAVRAKYPSGDSGYSNVFSYGGTAGPPSGLNAVKEGNAIRLNWTAPPGGADSYNCYVGAQPDLSDGVMMHLPGQVTATTYLTPAAVDAAVEHYFGVKAVVDSNETGYSNIAHYLPTGGGDITAPQWQGGIGIRSVEPDDQKVKIFWYPAIDPAPATPPVQYLIYFSLDGTPIDYNNPIDVVDAPATSYTIPGLINGQKYEFAVRAQDGVPNVTSNSNTLFATPNPFPPAGNIGTIVSSDIASVRMANEEVPRVFAVTHGNELWYAVYDGNAWQTVDLNTTLSISARKYHPQAVGVGDEIHVLFATATGVFELYGDKDADPATWTLLPVAAGMSAVYGTGYVYSSPAGVDGEYFAAVYAADMGATEELYYVERSPAGAWGTPEMIMSGDPKIWQCDMCISEVTGAQWVVACNGPQVSMNIDESPDFWYVTRPNKGNAWGAAVNTARKSSTEITVRIDPLINQPVVVNPETDWYEIEGFGLFQPATSAAIYAWNGTVWSDEPSSPIDSGTASFDGSSAFVTDDKGRDPQLVFSPTGKACAIYTNINVQADLIDLTYTFNGGWHLTSRPALAWSKPSTQIRPGIYSSNSVTAGESYQHCLTCYVHANPEVLDEQEASDKYATRNDYPLGDLYYFRQAWP